MVSPARLGATTGRMGPTARPESTVERCTSGVHTALRRARTGRYPAVQGGWAPRGGWDTLYPRSFRAGCYPHPGGPHKPAERPVSLTATRSDQARATRQAERPRSDDRPPGRPKSVCQSLCQAGRGQSARGRIERGRDGVRGSVQRLLCPLVGARRTAALSSRRPASRCRPHRVRGRPASVQPAYLLSGRSRSASFLSRWQPKQHICCKRTPGLGRLTVFHVSATDDAPAPPARPEIPRDIGECV
jgi:hypothetical protein